MTYSAYTKTASTTTTTTRTPSPRGQPPTTAIVDLASADQLPSPAEKGVNRTSALSGPTCSPHHLWFTQAYVASE